MVDNVVTLYTDVHVHKDINDMKGNVSRRLLCFALGEH